MEEDKLMHAEITDIIINSFYTVYNGLGYGFLEKVYENAMKIELIKRGLKVDCQKRIEVFYDQQVVGQYFADLLVEEQIIVELKAAKTLMEAHEAQLLNYLKATNCEIGLLLNFGPKPKVRRKIYSNSNNQYP